MEAPSSVAERSHATLTGAPLVTEGEGHSNTELFSLKEFTRRSSESNS